MDKKLNAIPDHTAVRTALWRAMHVLVDKPPYVLKDELGLQLVAPDESWRQRPDMHPEGTKGYRASIVGRARYIEDLLQEQIRKDVHQYVILGAGLDTFAQRRPDLSGQVRIFEIDKLETQQWKRQRLQETGMGGESNLQFVPVDFEAGESWREKLVACGFDLSRPAVIASTGVSMYLTKEANLESLRQILKFAKGSTFAMTFMLPPDMIDDATERATYEMVCDRARAAGTPFVSFFRPTEMLQLAREAGFRDLKHVSQKEIIEKYFASRSDQLKPTQGEEFLVVTV